MSTRHGENLEVFIGDACCGTLHEARTGALSFQYSRDYAGVPLSLSMPVGLEEYGDRTVRPYLMGLLPDDESTRAAIGARYGVSGDNPFRLLAHIGSDCPGAVRVLDHSGCAEGPKGPAGRVELSDAEIAVILRDIRERASAAWTGQSEFLGRWSLGGCQAKTALCKMDGRWFGCEGNVPSTHILKPGIAGFRNQALVEYLSMRTASSIGLPTARVGFEQFEDEWAVVIERYDRLCAGERIRRVHQEDFCQALGVSPLRKYADQGGPNTLRIIDLLGRTGGRAAENIHRFVLYLFFNYLVGATDAHAKNYSLVFIAPGDIRLAPLYDVASIAPYQGLSPRHRKPLRAAMSIGGENRFGCVTAEDVEKMVRSCGLGGYGLSARVLIRQFRRMAEMLPPSVTAEVDNASEMKLPGVDAVGAPLVKEITENCRRTLSSLQ